jgi:hypothetical protein
MLLVLWTLLTRVYNKVGNGLYSIKWEISQQYVDNETRQIDLSSDYTLFGEPTSMFEVLIPAKDIIVRVKCNYFLIRIKIYLFK